jgi:hypothetical protein
MSDGVSAAYAQHTSRDHLAPHIASPNRVLGGGVCLSNYPACPFGTLLWYDFALRSASIDCSCAHFPPLARRVPSRVDSQSPSKKPPLRGGTREGPARRSGNERTFSASATSNRYFFSFNLALRADTSKGTLR